jgi:hypothetical protein
MALYSCHRVESLRRATNATASSRSVSSECVSSRSALEELRVAAATESDDAMEIGASGV